MGKLLERRFFTISFCIMFFAGSVVSCATKRHAMDAQFESKNLGFLQDGKTNRQEILDIWGQNPSYRFEDGRIVIYIWSEEGKDFTGIYNVVLVFDENDILKKHSIVRVR